MGTDYMTKLASDISGGKDGLYNKQFWENQLTT